MSRIRWRRLAVGLGLYGGVFLATTALGGLAYFHFANPQDTCASCHEMTGVHSDWSASTHRTVHCRSCHGGSLTLDVHALEAHFNRVAQHFSRNPNAAVHLRETHVVAVHESCRSCHPQAFADWQASRHSSTYARFFLDPAQNQKEPPTNDCLRCHGMFLEGDMANLVVPPRPGGSWLLRDPQKATQPAIPCLACHQVHAPTAVTQTASPYNRREGAHLSAHLLPIASILDGTRGLKVSRDPRQRVCVQCHAPSATHQLASADDRTPAGVHEGLSCRDCHWSHSNSAKASCAACHPADSHCGLDVEKMDTTFISTTSRHNVHTVACEDCHAGERPVAKPRSSPATPRI